MGPLFGPKKTTLIKNYLLNERCALVDEYKNIYLYCHIAKKRAGAMRRSEWLRRFTTFLHHALIDQSRREVGHCSPDSYYYLISIYYSSLFSSFVAFQSFLGICDVKSKYKYYVYTWTCTVPTQVPLFL